MTEEEREAHPDSERVEQIQGALVLFIPCHGGRVVLPLEKAVAGALLRPVCPRDGRRWLLELVPDETAESGLRPLWMPQGTQP
ncbi:MAG: hypothetical protein ACRD0K_06020 [Egibacteraceae bacterium]